MYSGVSTACLFMREMNEDALTILSELNVRGTEIFLTTHSEYTEEFARLLKSRLNGMVVNSVHLLNTQFEPQLFGGHPRARKDAYEILEGAMRSAQIFGAERYTFHGITRLKKNAVSRDYGKLSEDFGQILSVCGRYGIRLCLESVHCAFYNEPGIFREIAKRCRNLGGVLDVKQARLSCYPYPMYIRDMEGRISHVHFSDVDDRGKICLPGKGIFGFEECLRRLKDAGFDGAVIIEVYAGDYGGDEELKQSCEYLDELIYKIGG